MGEEEEEDKEGGSLKCGSQSQREGGRDLPLHSSQGRDFAGLQQAATLHVEFQEEKVFGALHCTALHCRAEHSVGFRLLSVKHTVPFHSPLPQPPRSLPTLTSSPPFPLPLVFGVVYNLKAPYMPPL